MKENIRGILVVPDVDIKSWHETRRHRMAGELSFWRLRRSWLDTERDKVDQKIKEIILDMAESVGDLNYVYGERTETALDLERKKPSLAERILSRVSGSIRR